MGKERICHVDVTEASTNPSGSSEAGKTLWTWFKLMKGGHEFVSLHQSVLRCSSTPEREGMTLGRTTSLAQSQFPIVTGEGMNASLL